MADFKIKERAFRSGRIELRKQFHVQRRLGVVYPAFAGAKAVMNADPIMAASYITNAMMRLSDEDWDFVIDACLDVVAVYQGGDLWVPVKTVGAKTMQFSDLGLVDLNMIVFNVIYENFAPFIDALPSLVSAITDKVKTPV